MEYINNLKCKFKRGLEKKQNVYLDILLPFVLVVIAFIVRYWYVVKTDIGNDECFSLYYSQFSFREIVNALTTGSGFDADNPPLWELILSIWIKIFGIGLLPLRFLSLLFNVLTIVPLYKLANDFFTKRIAIGVSLLYIFSSFSLFLSHEGRVYSLVGFLAVTSVYLFMKQCENPNKFRWIQLLLSNVFLVYSHYIAAFWIILIEFSVIIFHKNLRKSLWKDLITLIIGLLLFCFPLVPTIWERFMDSGLNGTWIAKCRGVEEFYTMLCTFSNSPISTVFAIIIMLSSLVKVVILGGINKLKLSSLLIVLVWIIPLIVSFLLSFFVGFFLNRYFYFVLPFYLLTLIVCINYLFSNKNFYRILIECAFLVIMIFSFKLDSSTMRYAGWKSNVSIVAHHLMEIKEKKENACVIISPYWIDKQLVYYFDEDHTIFANEGKLTEPVFSDYLANKGYYYDINYHTGDYLKYPAVIIVHENWKDVSFIIDDLVNNGYEQENCNKFQQMTISVFCR